MSLNVGHNGVTHFKPQPPYKVRWNKETRFITGSNRIYLLLHWMYAHFSVSNISMCIVGDDFPIDDRLPRRYSITKHFNIRQLI